MVNSEEQINTATILGLIQAKELGKEIEVVTAVTVIIQAEPGLDIYEVWKMALEDLK